jgi:hypothetical protein
MTVGQCLVVRAGTGVAQEPAAAPGTRTPLPALAVDTHTQVDAPPLRPAPAVRGPGLTVVVVVVGLRPAVGQAVYPGRDHGLLQAPSGVCPGHAAGQEVNRRERHPGGVGSTTSSSNSTGPAVLIAEGWAMVDGRTWTQRS